MPSDADARAGPRHRAKVAAADDDSWCFCGQQAYGTLVECGDRRCAAQWFHLACVGLSEAPQGEWVC